jgi:hypothetical protein
VGIYSVGCTGSLKRQFVSKIENKPFLFGAKEKPKCRNVYTCDAGTRYDPP